MKNINIFLILVVVAILSSCKEEIPDENIMGTTEYYDSFLFSDYEPEILTQELILDFSDDAKQEKISNIKLEVVEKKEDLTLAPIAGIKVYQNGKETENNIISVSTDDVAVTLGIEFTKEAEERFYNLFIREYDQSKVLDELDVIDIEDKLYVRKVNTHNPLARNLIIISIVLAIAIVVWFILSRFIIWPSVPFGRVLIDYNDGSGDTIVKMNGKYELVLTNKKNEKDSFFSKLIKGSRKYEYNEFWEHTIIIKKGFRNKLSVTGLRSFNIEGEKVRREAFYIENEGGKKVKIETT